MAGLISKPETNIEPGEVNKLVYVKGDDGSYRGWKTELLTEEITDKALAKFLLCYHCGGVLRDACLFEKDGKQEVACSDCIPNGVNKQIAQMNREAINDKQVHCPLKFKGCDWSSELSELLHHLEACGLFTVACSLGCRDERGEVSRVEKMEVETHKTCCPMRTVHCEYCAVNVKSCEMDQHLEGCEEFPVPCPNECGQGFKVKRKDKKNHLSEECPLQLTECSYSQYGCEVKVQRMNLDLHEKGEMHNHLKVTLANSQLRNESLQNQLTTLVEENNKQFQVIMSKLSKLESENKEFRKQSVVTKVHFHSELTKLGNENKEIQKQSEVSELNLQSKLAKLENKKKDSDKLLETTINRITKLEKENEVLRTMIPRGSLEWKISGVKNKISQNKDTYSDPFYVGLYKLQGRIVWNREENCVGLFLCIMKGEWDDTLKWPLMYKYDMVLINQLDVCEDYEYSYKLTDKDLAKFPHCLNKPHSERNNGLGKPRFISHDDLLQDKYSKDDFITLKISVELIMTP